MGMLRIPHMRKQQWHPINDFSFILGVSGYTFGFVVKADSPHKTFNDDGGQMRLLVTFGEGRTKRWPNVPTAKELGYGVVSSSPYGLVGPKGMDAAVVKTLHDAFKKAMDDPKHLELLDQLNQDLWYRGGEDYARWAADGFVRDKALIERLGPAAK